MTQLNESPQIGNAGHTAAHGELAAGHNINETNRLATRTVLASVYYDPVAQVVASTTSLTLVDVDATNLAVTFTPSASGIVWVEMSALAAVALASDTYLGWGLRAGAADVARSHARILGPLTFQARGAYVAKFTGLTSGVAVTWKWAHRREIGTGTVYHIAGGAAGAGTGPAVMTVYAG